MLVKLSIFEARYILIIYASVILANINYIVAISPGREQQQQSTHVITNR